jgi:Skp family chaperone for outer membrane proteins
MLAAAALLALIAVLPAYSQGNTKPAGGTTAGGGPIPDSKIAYINTEAFGDEKQGITRFVNAVRILEREFQPRQKELEQIQGRMNAIAEEIKKTQNVADPNTIRQKQEQGDALARELDFKKKEAEAAYQKKYQEVVGPIYEDIGKALDGFAKQRGVTMLLDISKLAPAVLSADGNMDLTKAFIVEYNSRNPTTASR